MLSIAKFILLSVLKSIYASDEPYPIFKFEFNIEGIPVTASAVMSLDIIVPLALMFPTTSNASPGSLVTSNPPPIPTLPDDDTNKAPVDECPSTLKAPAPKPVAPKNDEVDTDFDTGRNELYKMLEKGNTAIDGILNLAKEGEHPRAYEVAGQLIKTQSEIAQNLLDLQDKLKKIKDVKELGPKNVTNALFVGSTTELQKMIKKNKDKK